MIHLQRKRISYAEMSTIVISTILFFNYSVPEDKISAALAAILGILAIIKILVSLSFIIRPKLIQFFLNKNTDKRNHPMLVHCNKGKVFIKN